ncbi:uncharacterized protein LOC127115568 [Lathyrus oleraceus]|uniref:uncharacterized protein LOC127115568 n=1 Tax=Pisum sativum TaxID=3888 RepID=UPI0021D3A718|nr:uncharacterized protein LOC127115568 [Pisum sativum]
MTEPVRVIPEALSIMIRLKFSLTVSITCLLDEEINKDAGENNFKQCSTVEIEYDNLIWDQAGTGNNNFVDQLVLENQHFYMQYLERFIRFLGTVPALRTFLNKNWSERDKHEWRTKTKFSTS